MSSRAVGYLWSLLPSRAPANLCRGLARNLQLSVTVVNNTGIVSEAVHSRGLDRLEGRQLGKIMTAATLLSSQLKGEERSIVNLNTFHREARGRRINITAESVQTGLVRAMVHEGGRAGEGGAVVEEEGRFTVNSILYGNNAPYSSTVGVVAGDVNAELHEYYKRSVQAAASVFVESEMDKENRVISSGGILVMALPECPEKVRQELFEGKGRMDKLIRKQIPIEDSSCTSIPALPGELQLHEKFSVLKDNMLFCTCSKERFLSKMGLLGVDELQGLRREYLEEEVEGKDRNKALTLDCPYCLSKYSVTLSDIEKVLTEQKN
eukprot:Nk52_evm1s330 gene=Nk52_evmTU1s330